MFILATKAQRLHRSDQHISRCTCGSWAWMRQCGTCNPKRKKPRRLNAGAMKQNNQTKGNTR